MALLGGCLYWVDVAVGREEGGDAGGVQRICGVTA